MSEYYVKITIKCLNCLSSNQINFLQQSTSQDTAFEETAAETEEKENDHSVAGPSTSAAAKCMDKSSRRTASDVAEKQMATAFTQLTNVLSQRQSNTVDKEDDECDLYAKLLAKKIRELPKDDRKFIY